MNYKSIFISDVHLGTRDCKAELLNNFLKHNKCETLYLVGDILDVWRIQQNRWYWKQSHTNVVRRILGFAKHGTRVVYVAGNHDEFLRPLMPYNIGFGNVEIVNQCDHLGIDGKKYLVIHGDLFDGITGIAPWLAVLGDRAYDFVLSINNKFNWWRHRFGFGYWSLSQFLKGKVKQAVDFIFQFEKNLISYAKKRGYDGVICGHIHKAEIKEIENTSYMNDGDWVESCTALVERMEGEWEIIHWGEIIDVDTYTNGDSYKQSK
jgi:UDP-2,3-diacylglucosamine pyrophosphatase LpxH